MDTFDILTRRTYPGFSIDLPEGTADVSTYAFVLPVNTRFRPSVVIKREQVEPETRLGTHVRGQIAQMEAQLQSFVLIEPSDAPLNADEVRIVFEWGEGDRRFRQVQRYYKTRAGRLFTLTGTVQAPKQTPYQRDLEQIMETFSPA